MAFLSEEELYKIAFDHKYHVEGCSILDGLVMQSFWRWLVEFLPLKHDPAQRFHWTAPNTLTLLGLILMVLPAGLLLWLSGDLVSAAPWWVYVLNAGAVFVYQTLDALDGKQARRTGSSSPFGELFDHGCDSVSCIFSVLVIVCIRQLGVCWASFGMVCGALLSFQGCHIQAYFVGCVTFGPLDVTELQFASMAVNLVAGLYDPNFFSSDTLVLGLVPAHVIPLVALLAIPPVALANNLIQSFRAPRAPHAPSQPAELWASLAGLYIPAALWFGASHARLSAAEAAMLFIALGFFNSIKSMQVILAHMCKAPLPPSAHRYNIPFILAAVNAHVGVVSEHLATRGTLLVALLLFLHFAASVSTQIAGFLGISIFKVCAPTRKDTRPDRARSE